MSARIVISTDTIKDALWIPAQALFESDGRKQVYLRTGSGFTAKEVELVRRSESRVVIKGLNEGDSIALTNPTDRGSANRKQDAGGSATKALTK